MLNRPLSRPLALLLPLSLLSFAAMSAADADEAHAGLLVGLDLNGGARLGEVSTDSLGLGADARIGYQLGIPLLRIAPELKFGYMGFALEDVQAGAATSAQNASERIMTAGVGARVGVDLFISPSVYAHFNYGSVRLKEVDFKERALGYDVGVALDFTALPIVSFGIHGGYTSLTLGDVPEADPVNWINFGIHAEAVF